MYPDFNKKTIDTLAKRSAYKCSNPDCQANTVGPNSDKEKSTLIGEAAHIYGARSGSKRYNPQMTDTSRAEITNSIWLCCNCHKIIDTDEKKYTTDILFRWREQHEKFIFSELGTNTERIKFEEDSTKLEIFKEYPHIVRRIAIDKPNGWVWRLTAELMRHLNKPLFQKLQDLRDGLYFKPQSEIAEEQIHDWIQKRLSEASNLISPISGLLDRLTNSWHTSDETGNYEEIDHIVCLIRDYLEQIVRYEEQIYFSHIPSEYKKLNSLLKDILGSQAEKLSDIPDVLDEAVSMIDSHTGSSEEKPFILKKTITFDLPENFVTDFEHELNLIVKNNKKQQGGCLQYILWSIIILIAILMI